MLSPLLFLPVYLILCGERMIPKLQHGISLIYSPELSSQTSPPSSVKKHV